MEDCLTIFNFQNKNYKLVNFTSTKKLWYQCLNTKCKVNIHFDPNTKKVLKRGTHISKCQERLTCELKMERVVCLMKSWEQETIAFSMTLRTKIKVIMSLIF